MAAQLQAAGVARANAELEAEPQATSRAREAEGRERTLLMGMVETLRAQLRDASEEAKGLRGRQEDLEQSRQHIWDQVHLLPPPRTANSLTIT